MNISSDLLNHYLTLYIWSFVRIAGVLMVAPAFSDHVIPATYRVMLALAICVVIAPSIAHVPAVDILSGMGMLILLVQFALGAAMGFVLSLVFQSFIIGGQIIAMQAGLGFANMMDPSHGGPVSLISQLYSMMLILIFFALNGHIQLISLLAHSFTSLPIGLDNLSTVKMKAIVDFSTWMFNGAVLLSLPAIISLLIVNVAFGIMTRSAPQLNIISIGFPITLTLGMYIVYLSMGSLVPHCEDVLESGFAQVKMLVEQA